MSTYGPLSGTGTQALSAGTGALHVHIDTLAHGTGLGNAFPANRYHQGFIRAGDGTAWWIPIPIEADDSWIPIPNGATQFAYSVLTGGVIHVTEVIGSNPFSSTPPIGILKHVLLANPAASVDMTGIPGGTYTHLELLVKARSSVATTMVVVDLEFNGDTTASHYTFPVGTAKRIGVVYGTSITATAYNSLSIWVPNYAATASAFTAHGRSGRSDASQIEEDGLAWAAPSPTTINEIKLFGTSGNFTTGSEFWLYGRI